MVGRRYKTGAITLAAAVSVACLPQPAAAEDERNPASLAEDALDAGFLIFNTITPGEGRSPQARDIVFIDYVLRLTDGTVIDTSTPPEDLPPEVARLMPGGMPVPLDGTIEGLREALLMTQVGGQYHIEVPHEQAYGANPPEGGPVPPNADLVFDLIVHAIMTEDEAMRWAAEVDAAMAEAEAKSRE